MDTNEQNTAAAQPEAAGEPIHRESADVSAPSAETPSAPEAEAAPAAVSTAETSPVTDDPQVITGAGSAPASEYEDEFPSIAARMKLLEERVGALESEGSIYVFGGGCRFVVYKSTSDSYFLCATAADYEAGVDACLAHARSTLPAGTQYDIRTTDPDTADGPIGIVHMLSNCHDNDGKPIDPPSDVSRRAVEAVVRAQLAGPAEVDEDDVNLVLREHVPSQATTQLPASLRGDPLADRVSALNRPQTVASQEPVQRPSVGRTVHFMPVHLASNDPPSLQAAIITCVHNHDLVDLRALPNSADIPPHHTSVPIKGSVSGERGYWWTWPART